MAGKPSAGMLDAMKMIQAGVTPYKAALRANLLPGTVYRSPLYKLWLAGKHDELRAAMDIKKAMPRGTKTSKTVA